MSLDEALGLKDTINSNGEVILVVNLDGANPSMIKYMKKIWLSNNQSVKIKSMHPESRNPLGDGVYNVVFKVETVNEHKDYANHENYVSYIWLRRE